jgi:hypothetical protein
MEFLKTIGEKVNKLLIEEWELQGHKMNESKFERELEAEVYSEGNTKGVRGLGVGYARFVNVGVSADRIPFGGRKTGAKTSAYIQGLIKYVLNRMGIGGAQGISIAFAIANAHKEQGMPTWKGGKSGRGSYAYTKTGKRTEFIEEAFKKGEKEIDEIVEGELSNYVVSILP